MSVTVTPRPNKRIYVPTEVNVEHVALFKK